MKAKERFKVLTALLETVLLDQGITLNEDLSHKIKRLAKSAGVPRKDAAEVLGPLLHKLVDKGLEKPKRRSRHYDEGH